MPLSKINEDEPVCLPTCRKIVGVVFVAIFRRALRDEVGRRETLVALLLLLLLLLILLPLVASLGVSEYNFS